MAHFKVLQPVMNLTKCQSSSFALWQTVLEGHWNIPWSPSYSHCTQHSWQTFQVSAPDSRHMWVIKQLGYASLWTVKGFSISLQYFLLQSTCLLDLWTTETIKAIAHVPLNPRQILPKLPENCSSCPRFQSVCTSQQRIWYWVPKELTSSSDDHGRIHDYDKPFNEHNTCTYTFQLRYWGMMVE